MNTDEEDRALLKLREQEEERQVVGCEHDLLADAPHEPTAEELVEAQRRL